MDDKNESFPLCHTTARFQSSTAAWSRIWGKRYFFGSIYWNNFGLMMVEARLKDRNARQKRSPGLHRGPCHLDREIGILG